MHDLLAQVRSAFDGARFELSVSDAGATTFDFEDLSVMGRVFIVDRPETIVTMWKEYQDAFLAENAARFQRDPTKAWNLYTLFLSAGPHSDGSDRALLAIEEDFRGTRKIAKGALTHREAIDAAIGPLLPLKHIRAVGATDGIRRLKDRLLAIAPAAVDAMTSTSTGSIAGRLLAAQ